ncbi:unnamed protein product [Leuciscus chuanchicus]
MLDRQIMELNSRFHDDTYGFMPAAVGRLPGGEKIPLLSEQPIKSLGRQCTAEFTDKQMGRTVMKQLSEGLAKIDLSQLPGKYKEWCNQFTLYMRVMWPLKMSEIPSSTTSKMDGKANEFIRKWLGLPRCLSETGLLRMNTLQLLLQSVLATNRKRPGLFSS